MPAEAARQTSSLVWRLHFVGLLSSLALKAPGSVVSTALGVICVGAGLAAWSGLLQRFCGKREAKYQRVPTNGAQLPRAARAALTPPKVVVVRQNRRGSR